MSKKETKQKKSIFFVQFDVGFVHERKGKEYFCHFPKLDFYFSEKIFILRIWNLSFVKF